jgi:hypothetical protein
MKAKSLAQMLRCTQGLFAAVLLLCVPVLGSAATFVSVSVAPPALPVYVQPAIPGPGYIWTPGYWAYGPAGYYWVPGTWVLPPYVGGLWTPGYWAWRNGAYLWNAGYWGPHVGFYGGVNYGFGYTGVGYVGGYWNNGAFYYNRAVNNVTTVQNTYNTTINRNVNVNRISYNGGPRGVRSDPTPAEREAMNERHAEPTETQLQHEHAAVNDRAMLASVNHGRPGIAATPQPGAFDHPGVVSARGNPSHNKAYPQGNPPSAHVQHNAQSHPPGEQARVHAQGAAASHPQGPHNGGEPHAEGQHR